MKTLIIKYKKLLFVSIFTFTMLGILAQYLFINQGLRSGYENVYPVVDQHRLVELDENTFLKQEFKSNNIRFKGLQYYLLKESDVQGMLNIDISVKEKVLVSRQIDLSEIKSGEWYFDFFDLKLNKYTDYTVTIYTEDCVNGKYPSLVLIDKQSANIENTSCYINDQEVDEAILLSYNFAKLESTYTNLSLFILAAFIGIIIIGLFFRNWYQNEYSIIFSSNLFNKIKEITVIGVLSIQFILILPNIIYKLTGLNLDPSWRYFLNISNELGLKYGTDIYFTYGPLGYICYLLNLNNSITYWIGILIWVIIFVIHIILLSWLYKLYKMHKISFMSILLSFLCYITVFSESERDNYQLYLLILAVVIYYLGNKKAIIISNFILVLMFFCKFSTFTSGVAFITIFVVLQFIFVKDRKCIFLMLPSFIAAPIAYFCYNPSLKGLYEYVTGILRISSGWMKTQQWDDAFTAREYTCFFMIIILYLILIITVLIVDYRKSSILFACSASLFFAYKYGVTAHGIAMSIWLTSLLFSVVMLSLDFRTMGELIHKKKYYAWLYGCSVICCCGIAILQTLCLHANFGQIKESLANKKESIMTIRDSSLTQELYENTYIPEEILTTIGDSTVTVYPWEVGYKAVYDELNMVYSPSIQNCNEFIPWLDQKVADYFYSDKAPKYIILEDETIYFHIKYLDNPITWEAIKDEYKNVVTIDGFCLLEKREYSKKAEMKLIKTELYDLSKPISCPEEADFVKINLEYSLAGKIKEFFWRSGMTYMTIKYQDGRETWGVIIVPNMPSGFSLEYVPQNLEDVSEVLSAEDLNKIISLEFSGIGLEVLEEKVQVEWYQYQ